MPWNQLQSKEASLSGIAATSNTNEVNPPHLNQPSSSKGATVHELYRHTAVSHHFLKEVAEKAWDQ